MLAEVTIGILDLFWNEALGLQLVLRPLSSKDTGQSADDTKALMLVPGYTQNMEWFRFTV